MIAWFAGQPLPTQIGLAILAAALLSSLTFFSLRKFIKLGHQEDLEAKDRVGLQIEFIKTTAQILGGLFFLVTIYVAWANLVVSQEKHKTDLFTKAIEQLGTKKLEVRLGGIYALERIARDSEKDHGPIMEVLTAYVREYAPWPPEDPAVAQRKLPWTKKALPPGKGLVAEGEEIKPQPDTDIQAILTVIGRLGPAYDEHGKPHPLDLRQTDLRGADLRFAHLERANLNGAHLEGAHLEKAHLQGAVLWAAHLEGAYLAEAHLEKADLSEAHLEKAHFKKAHLEGAVLWAAHLEWAVLEEAHLEGAHLGGAYLMGARLGRAHLKGAKLGGAHLEWARLYGTHLEGAKLKGAKGLTQKQIDWAIIDEKTELPDYLKKAEPDKAKPK